MAGARHRKLVQNLGIYFVVSSLQPKRARRHDHTRPLGSRTDQIHEGCFSDAFEHRERALGRGVSVRRRRARVAGAGAGSGLRRPTRVRVAGARPPHRQALLLRPPVQGHIRSQHLHQSRQCLLRLLQSVPGVRAARLMQEGMFYLTLLQRLHGIAPERGSNGRVQDIYTAVTRRPF